jgi:hypothetical protein
MSEWLDNNPFFLIIPSADGRVGVDLGTSGWLTTFAESLRLPGYWELCLKQTAAPVLRMEVLEGEQPYYTARHIGVSGSGGGNELIAYGIGKKRLDGHVDRLWVMPDGSVCGGDDVDKIGVLLVHLLGAR